LPECGMNKPVPWVLIGPDVPESSRESIEIDIHSPHDFQNRSMDHS
jgi:hypothetical protein